MTVSFCMHVHNCEIVCVVDFSRRSHTIHLENADRLAESAISAPNYVQMAFTVLVTRNFTKSADCPRRKSAVFPRHLRGYSRNRVRVSAESSKGVRGIVQGCPRNREWVSAES